MSTWGVTPIVRAVAPVALTSSALAPSAGLEQDRHARRVLEDLYDSKLAQVKLRYEAEVHLDLEEAIETINVFLKTERR